MALKFYSDVNLSNEITSLTTQHANTGSSVETIVYISNDNATKRYENISVSIEDTSESSEITWIQLAEDNSGVPNTYSPPGDSLPLINISDSSISHPFWVKVTTPSVSDSQNKSDLQLKISYREFAV